MTDATRNSLPSTQQFTLPTAGAERVEVLRAASSAQTVSTRADLEALVRLPSVSARAFDQAQVNASADAVAKLLRGAGMPEVEVCRASQGGTESGPAVIAR
ncbi:MAG: hypothetical protein ACRYF3_06430, partial [Janthinobacterium lividum]